MKYKLLLLDVDGTLVQPREDALPSKQVVEAVRAAQEKLHVAIATGRPMALTLPVVDALQLHGYGIFNNGAEILDTISNEVLARQVIDVQTLQELVRLALPFGFGIFTDANQAFDVPCTSPADITVPAAKLFIGEVPKADALAIIEELSGVDGVIVHPTVSWGGEDVVDIHVNHHLATKQFGAESLAEVLGIKKEEIIAIGDGHNDVPLLEAAGLKIAMGNAPEEVKAIADFVTGSLEEDGVAQAIRKFILN